MIERSLPIVKIGDSSLARPFRTLASFSGPAADILRDSSPLHLFEEVEVVAAYGEQLRPFFEFQYSPPGE